jgi:hypothetical protein
MEACIQGLGEYLVEVRGESEVQALLEDICGGRSTYSAKYRIQPNLAISGGKVHVQVDGVTIGLMDDDYASGYVKHLATTPYLNVTVWCEAMIVGGWDRGSGDRGQFGVKLDLPLNVLALDIIEGGPVLPDGSRKIPRGRARKRP